jgi:predicted Zn-ribbon and HTH transcriptional regulator
MSDLSRSQTLRQKIFLLLTEKEMTAREISQAIGIREKEVYEHLPHIGLSAIAQKRKLVVLPFGCMSCGYVFEQRKRFTRPSRCPRCKKTHLETPAYRLV